MTYPPNLPQHELLVELLAKNAEDAITLMGYIGPRKGEDHILVYPELADLSKSFEVKTTDIIHHTEAPTSLLPFGGYIFWLKKDSEIISRHTVGKSESFIPDDNPQKISEGAVEIHSGRLVMVIGDEKSLSVRRPGPQPCRVLCQYRFRKDVF